MDIETQEKTFEGFITWVTRTTIAINRGAHPACSRQRADPTSCALSSRPLSLVFVVACSGADTFNPAPLAEVQRRAYVHSAPPSITLYHDHQQRERRGRALTALLINGSQRVLWDPAGSFRHPFVPERGDLHYGVTENIRKAYVDYHVRDSHHVVTQKMAVPPSVAERLLSAAGQRTGRPIGRPVPIRQAASCATRASMSRAHRFPKSLMRDLSALPGVTTVKVDQSNVDTSHDVNFGDIPTPIPEY